MTEQQGPTVAIIGGGFTGAAIAWHLARDGGLPPTRIVVVEPRPRLGGGLAYSAADPAFRINVPAAKMSLDAGDIEDFSRWLVETDAVADDGEATLADGRVFPRRAVFGAYVASRLAPFLASGSIEHRRAEARAIEPLAAGRYAIALHDGSAFEADLVVLAVTHPAPAPPPLLARALAGHPRFVADTTGPDALAVVRRDDRVLVVGTGLTGADVIASLDRAGHRGQVTAIARRGLRSKGHPPVAFPPRGDFSSRPAASVHALLADIRAALAEAEAAGESWHGVFDALRNQGPAIWAALPLAERRRLVRHLRPFWDVHRFRVAPQVEAVLDRKQADGTLDLRAASLAAVHVEGEAIAVTLRPRHGGGPFTRTFDAVLVATGPAHGSVLASLPVLASLAGRGLLRPDPARLGIDTDREGRALSASGTPSAALLVGGPLARGTFGELMGLPEVAAYARFVADRVGDWRRGASLTGG